MTGRVISKNLIIENFEFRLKVYHPSKSIQVGRGNTNAKVVVVQPRSKIPERDAITGALKKFDMLKDAYRATSIILGEEDQLNRYYLKELIQIIDPLVVVACGHEVTALLSQREVRSCRRYMGKRFKVSDLTTCVFYGTLDPVDYGFARAPLHLKKQGKEEWTKLHDIYQALKTKSEKDRWAL
jgi:hypothetical protein